jgi:hypothetical protein
VSRLPIPNPVTDAIPLANRPTSATVIVNDMGCAGGQWKEVYYRTQRPTHGDRRYHAAVSQILA